MTENRQNFNKFIYMILYPLLFIPYEIGGIYGAAGMMIALLGVMLFVRLNRSLFCVIVSGVLVSLAPCLSHLQLFGVEVSLIAAILLLGVSLFVSAEKIVSLRDLVDRKLGI